MDPSEFSDLLIAFYDLRTGLDSVDIRTFEKEKQETWTTLHNALNSVRVTTQDELFSVSLSDLLHKIMIMACARFAAQTVAKACPGWPFVIMKIDAQIAKKKEREGGGEIQPIPKKRPFLWVPGWYTQNDTTTPRPAPASPQGVHF
jgi:hypothetical protein